MRSAKCASCYASIGWVGLVTNSVLMFLKGFVGLVSGSQALVADAMYSAKDVVTSFLVIVGLKVSGKPLDREHPYGHGKIEFLLSLIISVLFLAVTVYLMLHAIQTLMDESLHRTPHLIALWTALLSVAINVGMYFYSRCVVVEANSPMVRTLAKHHHADASASALVAAGIIGAHYMNMPWIDTAIALIETLHLLYLGSDVFIDAYRGLMDKNVDRRLRDRILRIVKRVDGVEKVRNLRARHVGQEVWVELTLQVSPQMNVADAHELTSVVQERLDERVPHLGSALVRFESHLPLPCADQDDLTTEMESA